jgi:hypothetical protein
MENTGVLRFSFVLIVALAMEGCAAFANMRFVSYDEQLQPSIGQPISAVGARIGSPYRVVQVGSEDHYVYLGGKFTPQYQQTSGDVTNGQISATTTSVGGDFVGCVVTFRVSGDTSLVVGAFTQPYVNKMGQGGCPGKFVQVAAN